MPFQNFIRPKVSKYDAVYFVADNQVINRVRVGSFKTRNRGAFLGSLAALLPSLHPKIKYITRYSWRLGIGGYENENWPDF